MCKSKIELKGDSLMHSFLWTDLCQVVLDNHTDPFTFLLQVQVSHECFTSFCCSGFCFCFVFLPVFLCWRKKKFILCPQYKCGCSGTLLPLVFVAFPFIYKWTESQVFHLAFCCVFVFVLFFSFGKWQHFIKGEDSLPIKDVSATLIKPLARVPAQQHPIINKSSRKEAFVTVYLLCFSSSPLISSSENWCALRLEQWLWQLMVSVITAQISSAVSTRSVPPSPFCCAIVGSFS